MELDSKNRLAHLKRLRDAKYSELRAATDFTRDIFRRHAELQIEIGRLEAVTVPPHVRQHHEDTIAAKRKMIAALAAEKAEATTHQDAASDAWSAAAQLFESCHKYASKHGLPLPGGDRSDNAVRCWDPMSGRDAGGSEMLSLASEGDAR
ncbi:hypothetical protein [Maritimibacter fusiformis]|uniref:Uncharacterized protein n=1 Tax=Maritimibacter fusiformis TaxID=2603819 RepID=A0A5D0RMI2_9RHOB|nr:hypothetical protein [Maritimibacter fusiformis]TYB81764.1 hypothetical protein FVF75_08650 [Maritimibacter fusiformis]